MARGLLHRSIALDCCDRVEIGFLLLAVEQITTSVRSDKMLSWALTFLVLAIIAAVFGFGGIAAGATQIAQILFVLFLVMFVVSLITGGLRGRTPV